MVTVAFYRPKKELDERCFEKTLVKHHKKHLLSLPRTNRDLLSYMENQLDVSYDDGYSHEYIKINMDSSCKNERLAIYERRIHDNYSRYLKTVRCGMVTYEDVLPVFATDTFNGDYATRHFYNRPCTMFFAFNQDEAIKMVNYWIKPECKEMFLDYVNRNWKHGMLMEIVF